jgi:hypothetical protein
MKKPDFRPTLRAAAAAAGYVVVGDADDGVSLLIEGHKSPWNPEDNDADAFALMVALELMPLYSKDGIGATTLFELDSRGSATHWACKAGSPQDRMRQTLRFAIVCAAARKTRIDSTMTRVLLKASR